MNPWWLLLIIPACVFAGFLICCILSVATCADCKDATRDRESMIQDSSFKAGFKEGLSKFSEVG